MASGNRDQKGHICVISKDCFKELSGFESGRFGLVVDSANHSAI